MLVDVWMSHLILAPAGVRCDGWVTTSTIISSLLAACCTKSDQFWVWSPTRDYWVVTVSWSWNQPDLTPDTELLGQYQPVDTDCTHLGRNVPISGESIIITNVLKWQWISLWFLSSLPALDSSNDKIIFYWLLVVCVASVQCMMWRVGFGCHTWI